MRDSKSIRPIHSSNPQEVMGCGNVFSFLNESRGFVKFYRIGSRFDFVASVAESPPRFEPSREVLEGQHVP